MFCGLSPCEFCPHHVLVHGAEAVFVFFVTAHEIEFTASVLTAPLQNISQQDPAGGKVHVGAVDACVVPP